MNRRKTCVIFGASVIASFVGVALFAPVTNAELSMTQRGLIEITFLSDIQQYPDETTPDATIPPEGTETYE